MSYQYQKFKKKHKLNSIIIAISGGQDSLSLIKLIQDIKKFYNDYLKIHYVYVDHQWKQDGKQQIKHLINTIGSNNNIFIYQIKDIIKSEYNARQARYQILIQHAIKYKYNVIITAHTETDKVETFYQQIIRGTSIDGATSLTLQRLLKSNIYIWRPLINFKRIEIQWLCRKYFLPIWSDITNYEYRINRNRLRNELMPYLKRYFSQNVETKINSFLTISESENEYIKQNAIKLYLKSCHKYNIALNYIILKKQHPALQARTIQLFIYHNLNKCLSIKMIDKIISVIHNNNIERIRWDNKYIIICNNWLYLC